jgi:beta-galactosidase
MICSNCERLKLYVRDKLLELEPDRKQFPHLPYPPFVFDFGDLLDGYWGDLRIEGYIEGKQMIVKHYSGSGVDQRFVVLPDSTSLIANGADTTRIVFRVTDAFGNVRPFANDPITFQLEGPAESIGDNPISLNGGVAAIWIRAKEEGGTVRFKATHPRLGTQSATIAVFAAGAQLL